MVGDTKDLVSTELAAGIVVFAFEIAMYADGGSDSNFRAAIKDFQQIVEKIVVDREEFLIRAIQITS
jgi:hypothetical protein